MEHEMSTKSSSATATKSATELMQAYHDSVRDPARAGALFAEDGVLELPWVKARAQGPEAISGLVAGILKKVPEFRFKNIQFWIQTQDKVYAEYQVEAPVVDTGKIYNQTYCGVLIAENGRIKLLREALNTAEAARAFSKD